MSWSLRLFKLCNNKFSFSKNIVLNKIVKSYALAPQKLFIQPLTPITRCIENLNKKKCFARSSIIPRKFNDFIIQKNLFYHSKKDSRYKFIYPLLGFSIFGIHIMGEEEKKESELIIMIKRGILAMQRDQLDIAEQLFHVALKTAHEQQESQGITYIYDLMANLAYQREDFVKAEKLFKSVMQRLLADGMEQDDNAIIEISLKLASIYANTEEIERAVTGFHYCIATQEKKIKDKDLDTLDDDTLLLWAMSLDWYARLLIRLGKYDLAKQHFIKAYDMSVKVNGSLHDQSAVLLNDIGSVCLLMKNYDEATQYLNKAVEVATENENPDIAVFYVNLGMLHMERNLFQEANESCSKGLAIATTSKNEDAIQEAKACINQIKVFEKEAKVSMKL